MELYPLLKTTHILLIATWFGIDLAVATCGSLVRNRELTLEARGAFGRLRRLLDLGPQVSMLLTVPVALALVMLGRWATIPEGLQPAVWWVAVIAAIVWAMVAAYGLVRPAAWNSTLGGLDVVIRVVIALAFLVPAVLGLAGGPGFGALWLDLKSLIFGVLVLCMVWVRLATRDTTATVDSIAGGDDSQTRENSLDGQLAAVRLPVAIIWAGIVVNVFLAVLRVG
ncbi:MAG: hypothetical protein U0556_08515 [Dehalococcoidia bacterium]